MSFCNKFGHAMRKSGLVKTLYRRFWAKTNLNVIETFPVFSPNSAGGYKDRAYLTVQAVNQFLPFLRNLAKSVNGQEIEIQDIEIFCKSRCDQDSVDYLKNLLNNYGSDKSNCHNYNYLYGVILADRKNISNVFEIGLGTNNTDVVSNMGIHGRPGASLRAFRDFCPNANVYGADIDKRVLFEEDRIKTFFIDQTDPTSFPPILENLPKEFDLVIDDGLHTPNANIASLDFALKLIKKGGWAVIEDIAAEAEVVWYAVAAMLPDQYESHLFQADGGLLFAVQRLR
jgi:cephalosporin hydroxylase